MKHPCQHKSTHYAYSDLKSKITSQKRYRNVTKGLRISPTGAMQHMHQLFRYQKVRRPNIQCAP